MGNKKPPVVIKLNPEKEIGYKVTDVGSGEVIKEGSTKVKDLDKKRKGGMPKHKDLYIGSAKRMETETDSEFKKRTKKLSGGGDAEFKDKLAKQRSETNMRRAAILKNLKDNASSYEDNLLKPGEDPGEGYKGAPDMYPDYEEDKKENKKLKRNCGGSANKYKSGSYVQVKTKLAKTKPCKLC